MIEPLTFGNESEYQSYVFRSTRANYCLDLGWMRAIRSVYKKRPYYWIRRDQPGGAVDGVLPAFSLSSLLLGKNLVSLPYLDGGGILADTSEAESELLARFREEAFRLGAAAELRCIEPLCGWESPKNEKVGMIVDLESLDESQYWKKLDNKVRNQVRKAEKSGVSLRFGRQELLDDFYGVFCRNMRDLGSPVHSRLLFRSVLEEFPGAEVGTAYRGNRCIGGLVRIQWRDTLAIPWASTLREERIHCPNNALYWESIRLALGKRLRFVDLGRSTMNEGTYRFKKQWLAREKPLAWYQFDRGGSLRVSVKHVAAGPLSRMASLWSTLPLWIANVLGPRLRHQIPA